MKKKVTAAAESGERRARGARTRELLGCCVTKGSYLQKDQDFNPTLKMGTSYRTSRSTSSYLALGQKFFNNKNTSS